MVLKSGFVVDRHYGHLDFGYVVTSHASQGKDRQVAIAAMGAESLPAINAKQFYVTVSRGSEDVMIFVDDKEKVRRAIARTGEQLSASEMLRIGQNKGKSVECFSQRLRLLKRQRDLSCRHRLMNWNTQRQTKPLATCHRQEVWKPSADTTLSRGLERG